MPSMCDSWLDSSQPTHLQMLSSEILTVSILQVSILFYLGNGTSVTML